MLLFLLLQSPTPAQVVVQVPERTPALLTLIYLGGLLLIVLLLLISLFRNRRRGVSVAAAVPEDLPPEVKRRRLGSTSTNRGCAPCAGYLFCFRFPSLAFISIGPATLRKVTKNFRS